MPPGVSPRPGEGPTVPARGLLALGAAAIPVAVLVLSPGLDVALPGGIYVAVHALVEIAVVSVCFATFAVQWYAAEARTGEPRGRFLGAAFLAIALLEAAHLLSFPGMTAFGPGSTGRGIWYWLAARLWTVAALFAAALITPRSEGWWLRRRVLLAGALGATAALVLLEVRTPTAASLFFVPGTGLTPLKKALELVVMVLAALTGLLYLRLYRGSGERAPLRIAAALAVTVLSELCFTLYASPYDAFNLLGHAYLALAFYLIFDALFVAALLRPYADLRATSLELASSNEELTRLRRHVEDELAVTIARLEETRQLQADMLRAVTHDVRTPLQVIMLQAERLRRKGCKPEQVPVSAQTILDAARRIAAMVRDLVDATQLERGGLTLARQAVCVPDLLNGLVASSAGVLDTARIQLEIPPGLPPVEADPSWLERILANLIGNALKYSGPGTPVRVAASAAEREMEIAISDRGPGIAADDLPHIFDRFYRGRSASGEGLGLGLHIARLLARAHGGDVSAESFPGSGTTFAVKLPLGPQRDGAAHLH